MKTQKWMTRGALLAVTLLACFGIPVGRAQVATTWNYAAQVNDWMVYSIVGDDNGTAIPLTYQKTVFTKLAKINDTQYFLNTTTYDNTTASPKWDTIGNWTQNRISAIRVNDTATSPVICFNLTLPADVSLTSAYTQANVAAMFAIIFPDADVISVNVSINGRNVTLQLFAHPNIFTGAPSWVINATYSFSYNAANLVNASSSFVNWSVWVVSTLQSYSITTMQTSLVAISIGASASTEEIPAFPVEWMITATATAAVLLARRKRRDMQ